MHLNYCEYCVDFKSDPRVDCQTQTSHVARRGRLWSSRSAENIAAVAEDVRKDVGISIRRRATQIMAISRRGRS